MDQMKKPYTTDWVKIRPDLEHSYSLNLYWKDGKCRDELSAKWAGWIGTGAILKDMTKEQNHG